MPRTLARPIKTERDYKDAASIAGKTRQQAEREPAAERRLKALLDALEKYDNDNEDEGYGDATEDIDSPPRRRWSDDL